MTSAAPQVPAATPETIEQGSSLWRDAWRRLAKNKLALSGAGLLGMLAMLCVFVPFLPSVRYEVQNLNLTASPPLARTIEFTDASQPHRGSELTWEGVMRRDYGATLTPGRFEERLDRIYRGEAVEIEGRTFRAGGRKFLFGTDTLGRDLFARILYGGRISIGVGLCATFVALAIGVTYGAVSGFFGGKTDMVMMRVVDIMYALPFTIFVILLTVYFGRDIVLLFVAIGAVEWLTMARIVRGQIQSLKKMEFIEAAHALGFGKRRIIFRHMIPNALGPIIVYATLTIPAVMLLEAFLSFLGLGVQPPMSSWGTLIKEGAEKMEEFPWLLIFPGAIFSLTLFSLNFLGDGLRDALDVRTSKD